MKIAKRMFAMVLIVVSLAVVMVIPAFASAADSTIYNFRIVKGSFTNYTEIRSKDDTTACYLYVKNSQGHSVQARAMACGRDRVVENQTVDRVGRAVDYANCPEGGKYSIHSNIKENGYSYATLAFRTKYFWGTSISGEWSPDTINQHTEPVVVYK